MNIVGIFGNNMNNMNNSNNLNNSNILNNSNRVNSEGNDLNNLNGMGNEMANVGINGVKQEKFSLNIFNKDYNLYPTDFFGVSRSEGSGPNNIL